MISLLLDDRIGAIAPELYGCLIESYRTLLDGIWVGNESSIPNDDGLRLDTIEALRELGTHVVRFPGGTPADFYRWRDGVGPRSKRPRTWNFFFGGEDSNEFGTDEFLRFCEAVGASSCIKINPITAPLHEALDWMQYCNYDGNTTLASQRRENGHPEPYGVTYWVIGNETTDASSPERYADLVFQWTFFIRQVDPMSKIIAEGGETDWNERFLKRLSQLSQDGGIASNNQVRASAAGIRIQPGWKLQMLGLKYPSEETIRNAISLIDKYFGEGTIELCVEEWEAQTEFTCGWPQEWRSTMSIYEIVLQQGRANLTYENEARLDGALMAAERMHLFMRYAKHVKMATFIYPTNTWAPLIKTDGASLIRTPPYHALAMLNEHLGAEAIAVDPDGMNGLDVMASLAKDEQRLTVSLVNREGRGTVDVTLGVKDRGGRLIQSATATVLTGNGADQNTFDDPDRVRSREARIGIKDGKLSVSCEPVSLTVVSCVLAK